MVLRHDLVVNYAICSWNETSTETKLCFKHNRTFKCSAFLKLILNDCISLF